jgi:exosome complex component RRP45
MIDDCGNLTDCASIATIAALLAARHPAVSVEGTEAIVHTATEKETVPLSIHHIPVSVSFGFFHDGFAFNYSFVIFYLQNYLYY